MYKMVPPYATPQLQAQTVWLFQAGDKVRAGITGLAASEIVFDVDMDAEWAGQTWRRFQKT